MNDFITYMIKSGISLIALYGIYWVFMRKESYFTLNRFYLLAALLLSFLLPLLRFHFPLGNSNQTYYILLETITISADKVSGTGMIGPSAFQVFLIVYLVGAIVLTVRLLYELLQILHTIHKYGIQTIEGEKFVFTNQLISPFSFLHIIFIQEKAFKNIQTKKIIEHERIHVKQLHTLDVIFVELLTIFQWFNPALWLYRKSLKEIHEFLADDGVIRNNTNSIKYKMLLLNQVFGVSLNDITNHFNQSILKRRFTMMTKTKSKRRAGMKLLLSVPLSMFVLFVFTINTSVLAQETDQNVKSKADKPVKEEVIVSEPTDRALPQPPKAPKTPEKIVEDGTNPPPKLQKEEDPIYTVVKHMPQFPGGKEAMFKFITKNLKYPEEAIKNKIQGRVFVTFVVEKNGKVTHVELLRGIDEACDKEAKRVIESMPNWEAGRDKDNKPLRVQFNLPINFTLSKTKKEKE